MEYPVTLLADKKKWETRCTNRRVREWMRMGMAVKRRRRFGVDEAVPPGLPVGWVMFWRCEKMGQRQERTVLSLPGWRRR